MLIHHRGIYHDRLDAPFVGTLVFAKDCHHHCPGCCHEGRHHTPIYEEDSVEIIKKILDYGFSEGLVLGGFEWTEQPDELLELIREARLHELKIILYTHHTEDSLRTMLPELYSYKGIYVKYGEYREEEKSSTNIQYGIPLASENQYIKII